MPPAGPPGRRPGSTLPVATARTLRKRMTPQEARLWVRLRALRGLGFHFRRQVAIGRFVVDFASLRDRVVIEVDGGQHGEAPHAARDAERDAVLASLGFRVMRFWNSALNENPDDVAETVYRAICQDQAPGELTAHAACAATCKRRGPPHPALPWGEGCALSGKSAAPMKREPELPPLRGGLGQGLAGCRHVAYPALPLP
ncbi:MAG: hypothetical protein JWN93_3930 [Hyphomicrobiales bacterium]|nr:hypothetical protein [Hyphomicrobiales bacterium]